MACALSGAAGQRDSDCAGRIFGSAPRLLALDSPNLWRADPCLTVLCAASGKLTRFQALNEVE